MEPNDITNQNDIKNQLKSTQDALNYIRNQLEDNIKKVEDFQRNPGKSNNM
jgi:hypothetical protein